MNRLLASTLSALNGVLAVMIIILFVLLGRGHWEPNLVLGTIMGAIGGVLVASCVCGTIAFITLIERHLRIIANGERKMAGAVREAVKRDEGAGRVRTEPSF